ncbi:Ulp1 protease family catalytic domain containing protein [Entamoeba histolytica HM-1:IMSS-B]|uniref:Ulp1 protease family, C-terminal catalytic domain containing protein n=5 Tax=Entamoeba histolytica TaxID=5759 RepID=C4LY86_ENTH1|nr:Ulp1 protease family, C-terminal catalytic domain containing protein [Entamoeba histolytica HM-1:IMSS]EMD44028.1 Ulp1 protease familyterminal catalytic domain containing protein [Entamoeba histolytica KU27]EMH77452.1 Ulp1 protease family catalytic domain containing protein [Entamoeba histolytica HM-1:IMSS-B]ENY60072.1 Ulp1 protease family, C-terminal catalytic domain containing protein [Entamoeba histolytica HM-1:IMSS-A]GAT93767.1 ulp1 protease family c-terminal catalytic domain containing p|eukprot:XP_650529.1 Ulp1 protease family, C-terminal catalytic domain containing protein [Entamoeba histolytica HM-1:IMSS]
MSISTIGDVTLYSCDEKLVKNGWFNDNLICYQIEYIKKEFPLKGILIIDPLGFVLLSLGDEKQLLNDLNAKEYHHIIITVNDLTDNNTVNNGSHWTLLYIDILSKIGYYYDSVPSHSTFHAEILLNKISLYFGFPIAFHKAHCPLQTNGFDCGPHVLANIYAICTLLSDNSHDFEVLHPHYTASEIRSLVYSEIHHL